MTYSSKHLFKWLSFHFVPSHQAETLFRFQNTFEASRASNTKENVWQESKRISLQTLHLMLYQCVTENYERRLQVNLCHWKPLALWILSNRLLFSMKGQTNQVYLQYTVTVTFQLSLFTLTYSVVLRIKPIVLHILCPALPRDYIPGLQSSFWFLTIYSNNQQWHDDAVATFGFGWRSHFIFWFLCRIFFDVVSTVFPEKNSGFSILWQKNFKAFQNGIVATGFFPP